MSDQGQQPMAPGALSPDGLYVWDGYKWWEAASVPVGTSLDGGQTVWDGHTWSAPHPDPPEQSSATQASPESAPGLWDSRDGYTLTMEGWLPTPIVEERRKEAEELDHSSGNWAGFSLLFSPLGIVAFVKNRSALKMGRPMNAKVSATNGWAGLGIFIFSLVLVLGFLVYTQTEQGFHNAQTLSDSVVQEINHNMATRGQTTRVTTATCVKGGQNDATCLLTLDDGTQTSINVTIASDGSSWVTK